MRPPPTALDGSGARWSASSRLARDPHRRPAADRRSVTAAPPVAPAPPAGDRRRSLPRSGGDQVDPGELLNGQGRLGPDRQLLESLPEQAEPQGSGIHLEVRPSKGRLDRHLSEAHDAQRQRLQRVCQMTATTADSRSGSTARQSSSWVSSRSGWRCSVELATSSAKHRIGGAPQEAATAEIGAGDHQHQANQRFSCLGDHHLLALQRLAHIALEVDFGVMEVHLHGRIQGLTQLGLIAAKSWSWAAEQCVIDAWSPKTLGNPTGVVVRLPAAQKFLSGFAPDMASART